ncbi:helix-turn-helix transcriptional regulator [Verticiella sediminum]|nr:helix-turn-helix transcriptional regulator [Verticiella sediminum]
MTIGNVALSARQKQCLWWASLGKTSKETALILGVAERTVNFHLYKAFEKLDVHTKHAAVAQAMLRGVFGATPTEPGGPEESDPTALL